MHIDCATCPGRPTACDGCAVSVLLDDIYIPTSEVRRNKPVTDHEARIAAAVEVFRSADMVAECGPIGSIAPNPLLENSFNQNQECERKAG